VSGERVGAELRLLAREGDPLSGLGWLRALGLDRAIEPGFGLGDRDLGRRALELLPSGERRDRLVVALAARGVEPRRLAALLDDLAFPAGDRDAVVAAAAQAGALAARLAHARAPSEIAGMAGDGPPELVALAGALGAPEPAREWLERLRHVRLEIGGDDLLAAGVPEGPGVGTALRAALAAKLDGQAGDRAAELEHALAAVRAG
jgi:tRNA nucleotidyltransferase (CCA-adding enzyme)